MAGKKGETIGGLYLRIGLSYDELNQDFVNVEETLSANIQRLNRENRLINLKADIDLTRATDAAQKLKIQQESLTRQIDIQREKVKLYESEWIAAGKANGVGSQQAQKAAISLQQQTLVLARLEQKLKEIQSTQSALPKSDNPLLAGYKGIKGDVTGAIGNLTSAFTGLKDASSSVDSAITKSLEIIGNIPSPVGKAVAALASIPLIAKGIENSLLDMAKPAVEAGDKMYVMSRGMQLNVKDMAQLSTVAKVTGISIDEVNSSLRRFSAQITKAEGKDTLMNRTLKQYGLDVRDANGNIKQGIELAKVLSEGLQKAQAIGKGAEFRDIMGGRALWTGDFVTFLEDLNGNIETAGKIVKNGLANPTLAHEVQGNINAMNAQAAQMGGAFSSALMPVANELVPKITARMGELTKVIAENAAGIKNIGFAISSVVEITGNLTSAVVELGAKGAGVIGKAFTADTDALIDRYGVLNNQIKSADDLMAAEMRLKSPQERSGIENNPAISQQTFSYYQRQFQKIEEWRKKVGKSWADFRKEAGNPPFTINQPKVEGLEESLERIKKYSEELEKINLDLKFGDDTYGKSIAELDLWYDKALKGAKNFEEERNSLAELYGAKRAQIERQHDEEVAKAQEESGRRIRGLTEETASMQYERTHSAYEKQIYDIERWKERSIAAIKDKSNAEAEAAAITANAAEKASQAFAKEMDRIRGNIQSLEEKIFEQEHSHRDIDLLRVQKERAQYLKENYPADLVEHWYQGELRKIQERAAKDKDYLKSPSSSSGNSGFIMYGNQIDGSSPLITYGDKLNGASSMLIAYGNEPQQDFSPVKNFYDELKQSTDRRMEQYGNLGSVAENIATSLQGIDSPMQNFQKSLEDISASTGSISYQFDLVGSASEELANAFSQAAMTISEVKGSLSNTQVQYQSPNNEEFLDTRVAEVYSTFPNDTESGYNFSEVLATINASLQELMQLSSQNPTGINAATQELTEQLSQVLFSTAKAAELANNQQNITVSPTINVDLGGAYVFDDEMKQQLTDDITAEVANAVTSAVQDATSKANYGYGN